MQSTEQKIERAALAGLAAASMDERERSTDISLAELAALVGILSSCNQIKWKRQWIEFIK